MASKWVGTLTPGLRNGVVIGNSFHQPCQLCACVCSTVNFQRGTRKVRKLILVISQRCHFDANLCIKVVSEFITDTLFNWHFCKLKHWPSYTALQSHSYAHSVLLLITLTPYITSPPCTVLTFTVAISALLLLNERAILLIHRDVHPLLIPAVHQPSFHFLTAATMH